MQEDFQLYPDMAAYHSIAVTLGQSGLVRELMNIVECMRQKPSKIIRNGRWKNWDPVLEPDLVVYNAVSNYIFFTCSTYANLQLILYLIGGCQICSGVECLCSISPVEGCYLGV